MKILLLCLNAFEMMEVSPFIDVFGWARDDFNSNIKVVTCSFQENPTSTFGISIKIDVLIDDVNIEDYAAPALPGGFEEYGFYEEAYHEKTITSSCPKTAPDVAFQLLEMLTSKEQTIQVKEAMGYELL